MSTNSHLFFLITAMLICVKWNLRVVWICIFLMVNDIQLLFMYLLAIYMSSLEIFKLLFHFVFCFVFWTRTLINWLIVPSLKCTGCYNSRFLRFEYGYFRDLMSKLWYTVPVRVWHLVLAPEIYCLPRVHFSRRSNHKCLSHWDTFHSICHLISVA